MSREPLPNHSSPALSVPLTNGGRLDLQAHATNNHVLLVFYRGLHCPKCKDQLQELDGLFNDFAERNISVIPISMDSKEKANETVKKWQLKNLHVGYNLTDENAKDWGLFLSEAEFDYEPKLFNEPGTFLVSQGGRLYASWVQNTPFARPHSKDIVAAFDIIKEKQYPPRGKAA